MEGTTMREDEARLHAYHDGELSGFARWRFERELSRSPVLQRELELINRSLDHYSIEVFHGTGTFRDEHTVSMLGHRPVSTLLCIALSSLNDSRPMTGPG